MKIKVTIEAFRLKVTSEVNSEIYFIEQSENEKFYITSDNGYDGYQGDGWQTIEQALKHTKSLIKNS